jgi:hypothetical protein
VRTRLLGLAVAGGLAVIGAHGGGAAWSRDAGSAGSSTTDREAASAGISRAPVGGTPCQVFPSDNYWNADISSLPVHPRSATWLSHMSTGVDLHPDFGPSFGDGPNYGIPVTVVGAGHPKVRVRFRYASESDHVRYPLGADTRIEGGRRSDGDRHAVIVDKGTCRLYETFDTRKRDGRWHAGSGATWSLGSDHLRPDGWTSADAAGLPILPGLLRWNEVKHLHVDHAIRFTTDVTSTHHLWPARHDAGSRISWTYPPMGARFRLVASYHPTGFGPKAMAVVRAMKTYGLVLADNGSPWFFQGEQNGHWPIAFIDQLKRIPADKFVAVDTSSLKVSNDSAATQQP